MIKVVVKFNSVDVNVNVAYSFWLWTLKVLNIVCHDIFLHDMWHEKLYVVESLVWIRPNNVYNNYIVQT